MTPKEWVVLLLFLLAILLAPLLQREHSGLFKVWIAIVLIFRLLSWLLRDRDTANEAKGRHSTRPRR